METFLYIVSAILTVQVAYGDFVVSFENWSLMPHYNTWFDNLQLISKVEHDLVEEKLKLNPMLMDPILSEHANSITNQFKPWMEVFREIGLTLATNGTLDQAKTVIVKSYDRFGVYIVEETMDGRLRKIIQSAPYAVVEDLQNMTLFGSDKHILNEDNEASDISDQTPKTTLLNKQNSLNPEKESFKDKTTTDLLKQFVGWQDTPLNSNIGPLTLIHPDCPDDERVLISSKNFAKFKVGGLTDVLLTPWQDTKPSGGICPTAEIHCIRLKTNNSEANGLDILEALNKSFQNAKSFIILHPFELYGIRLNYLKRAYGAFQTNSKILFVPTGNTLVDQASTEKGYIKIRDFQTTYPVYFKKDTTMENHFVTIIDYIQEQAGLIPPTVTELGGYVLISSEEAMKLQGYKVRDEGLASYSAAVAAGIAYNLHTRYPTITASGLKTYIFNSVYHEQGIFRGNNIVSAIEDARKKFPRFVVYPNSTASAKSPGEWLNTTNTLSASEVKQIWSILHSKYIYVGELIYNELLYGDDAFFYFAKLFAEIGRLLSAPNTLQDQESVVEYGFDKLKILIIKESANGRMRKIIESVSHMIVEDINDLDIAEERGFELFPSTGLLAVVNLTRADSPNLRLIKDDDADCGVALYHKQFNNHDKSLKDSITLIDSGCPVGNKMFKPGMRLPDNRAGILMSFFSNYWFHGAMKVVPICPDTKIFCVHLAKHGNRTEPAALLQSFEDSLKNDQGMVHLHPFTIHEKKELGYLRYAYKKFVDESKLIFAQAEGEKDKYYETPECTGITHPSSLPQCHKPKPRGNFQFPEYYKNDKEIKENLMIVGVAEDMQSILSNSLQVIDTFAPHKDISVFKDDNLNFYEGPYLASTVAAGIGQLIHMGFPDLPSHELKAVLVGASAKAIIDASRGYKSRKAPEQIVNAFRALKTITELETARIEIPSVFVLSFNEESQVKNDPVLYINHTLLLTEKQKEAILLNIAKNRKIPKLDVTTDKGRLDYWEQYIREISLVLTSNRFTGIGDKFANLGFLMIDDRSDGVLPRFLKSIPDVILEETNRLRIRLLGTATQTAANTKHTATLSSWYLYDPWVDDLGIGKKTLGAGLLNMFALHEKLKLPHLKAPLTIIDPTCPDMRNVYKFDYNEPRVHAKDIMSVITSPQSKSLRIPGTCPTAEIECIYFGASIKQTSSVYDVLSVLDEALELENPIILHPYEIYGVNTQFLKRAYKRVFEKKLLIAAAGNQACNSDLPQGEFSSCLRADGKPKIGYPAALKYDDSLKNQFLVIGATDVFGNPSETTNRGKILIDLFAPGEFIPAVQDGWLSLMRGTSFSASIVAGIATFIRTHHPHISNQDLIQILSSSVYKTEVLEEFSTAGGIVNGYDSLALLTPSHLQNSPSLQLADAGKTLIISFDLEKQMPDPIRWLNSTTTLSESEQAQIFERVNKNPRFEQHKIMAYLQDQFQQHIIWKDLIDEVAFTLTISRSTASPESAIIQYFNKLGMIALKDRTFGKLELVLSSMPHVTVESSDNMDVVHLSQAQNTKNIRLDDEVSEPDWNATDYMAQDSRGFIDTIPVIMIDPTCPKGINLFSTGLPVPNSQAGELLSYILDPQFLVRDRTDVCELTAVLCVHLDAENNKTNAISVLSSLNTALNLQQSQIILHPYELKGKGKVYLKRAYEMLGQKNKLLVVAAGNSGCNATLAQGEYTSCFSFDGKTSKIGYPAVYYHNETSPNIMVVGSSTAKGDVSYFSNRGEYFLDIMAPGENVPIKKGEKIVKRGGTAFSAAIVAEVAQCYLKRNPLLSMDELKSVIFNHAMFTSFSKKDEDKLGLKALFREAVEIAIADRLFYETTVPASYPKRVWPELTVFHHLDADKDALIKTDNTLLWVIVGIAAVVTIVTLGAAGSILFPEVALAIASVATRAAAFAGRLFRPLMNLVRGAGYELGGTVPRTPALTYDSAVLLETLV